MSSQPGWHPDPVPPQPGQPPQLRYWDGARWTEHVAPAQPPAYGGPASPYAGGKATTTPDGVALAGWWQRVGAYLIDGLLLAVISGVLYIPFYGRVVDAYRDYFHDVERATDSGGPQPSPFRLQEDLAGTLALMGLIGLVVGFVWTVGWLRWKQATPGKLALGLRVRLRDQPGPLPWRAILLRWLTQTGVGALSFVPVVGSFIGLYSLLDVLWPLWDDKRQALHDKAARTNVVRVR